jgi:hypothetical protein
MGLAVDEHLLKKVCMKAKEYNLFDCLSAAHARSSVLERPIVQLIRRQIAGQTMKSEKYNINLLLMRS